MFCNQCEETLKGVGCTKVGVCGKKEVTSNLQDLILDEMVALSLWATEARRLGVVDQDTDDFALKAIFHTVTNVDFDDDSLANVAWELHERTTAIADKVRAAGGSVSSADTSATTARGWWKAPTRFFP